MAYHRQILIALVFTLAGCGGSYPRPEDYSDSAQRLLDSIEKRGEALRSLSGELSVELWREGKRIRAKQLIAVDREGRLRIEVLSPFGHPITTLVSDGSRLMIYDAREKRFHLGAATAHALARLLPVPISPAELSAMMRGAIPTIQHTEAVVSWNSQDGRYRLSLTGGKRRQMLELEPKYLRVTLVESTIGGKLLYRAKLGNYSGSDDTIVPQRILFEAPARELRVDLTVTEHTMNPKLPDTAFTLEPPRGILVEPL